MRFKVDAEPFIPLLIQTVAEALIPKERQKQEQQQLAINTLARLHPTISKLPEEEKGSFTINSSKRLDVSAAPLEEALRS